jgi:hypothetical protein
MRNKSVILKSVRFEEEKELSISNPDRKALISMSSTQKLKILEN